jgi:hypothetical protein
VVLVRKEVKKEDIAIRNQAGNPIFVIANYSFNSI